MHRPSAHASNAVYMGDHHIMSATKCFIMFTSCCCYNTSSLCDQASVNSVKVAVMSTVTYPWSCEFLLTRHTVCVQQAGYVGKVKIGMDVAASEFFENDKYNLDFKSRPSDPEQVKTGPELQEQYSNYCKQYPIISIEDPFDQDDFDSYANLTSEGVCQVGHSLPRLSAHQSVHAHISASAGKCRLIVS